MSAAASCLEIRGLTKHFYGVTALEDYGLDLPQGEILGLIGPNGAGKTTIFNLITGVYRPSAGQVQLFGRDVTGLRPERIAQLGVARTFQNIRLFRQLTVLDNVRCALHLERRYTLLEALAALPRFAREERHMVERALALLEFLGIAHLALEPAGDLSYGDQRRLEVARALAMGPKILLLDEPTAGMSPLESAQAVELFRKVRDQFGLTLVLIEHHMQVVMGLCERLQVLNYGRLIAEGRPEDIRVNPEVVEAYLGKDLDA